MNSLVFTINLFHLICWLHIFLGTLTYFSSFSFFESKSFLNFIFLILKITQTLQVTDMMFSLLKFTKGSTFGSFLQITGRNFIVWFILSQNNSNAVLALVLLNWSFADVVRYLYYLFPNDLTLFLR